LGGDEARVRGCVRFGTQVVRGHVPEPVAGQRRVSLRDHGGQSDVACLGDQHGGDRQRELAHPLRASRDALVLIEEPGPGMNLEKQLGQVDPRQHRRDEVTQVGQ